MTAPVTFTKRPLRRIALSRVFPDRWQAVVAGPDNRLMPGFGQSEIYADIRDATRVACGLHQRTGLPLDLSEPLARPRPKNPGGGERVAA